jgi:serine/threonine protein kinase
VKQQGALLEDVAVGYIKQVASALNFVHQHSINHLDVKPANIMVRQSDNKAILIDFGLSKQYDEQGGQTSTTPVGISHGYAPMEQYNQGGVSTFSPQTDIYSLGATLYKLVTGNTPPQAIEIFNEGLTGLPQSLSHNLVAAIKKTMQPKKGDRPQSIGEFTNLLGGQFTAMPNSPVSPSNSDESTRIIGATNSKLAKSISSPQPTIAKVEGEKQSSAKKWLWFPVVFVIAILAIVFWPKSIDDFEVYEVPIGNHTFPKEAVDSTYMEVAAVNSATHEEPIEAPKTKKAELTGKINGYEYVDLGLNVKWATCNVGASSPSDFGNYYAWGEITTKKDYSVNNYVNSTADDYIDIGSNISGTKYDAARKLWGSTWRIPTLEEIEELEKKCSWTWISQGGNNGYRIVGPSGKSIFLPAAGYRYREELERLGSGSYWSSTSYRGPGTAHCLDFSNSYFFVKGNDVDYGRPIRPVSD